MRIALLIANEGPPALTKDIAADVSDWQRLFGAKKPQWKYQPYNISANEWPKPGAKFDAFILSGRLLGPPNPAPGSGQLEARIQHIVDSQIPLLGAGLGHLYVTQALGGAVEDIPQGWNLGSIETEVRASNPWMPVRRFWQFGVMAQRVSAMPKGAELLLREPSGQNGGYMLGHHLLTVQNHPEISRKVCDDMIFRLEADLPPNLVQSARDSLALSADTGHFADALIHFLKLSPQC